MHARADVDKLLPTTDILITTPFHPVRARTSPEPFPCFFQERKKQRMKAKVMWLRASKGPLTCSGQPCMN